MKMLLLSSLCLLLSINLCTSSWKYGPKNGIFSWKQLGFSINGIPYCNSTDFEFQDDIIYFPQELDDSEKFFIQPNNVPIGMEVYGDTVFITVPRRRYGIPSTLNYVKIPPNAGGTFSRVPGPLLMPYPDEESNKRLVSVYRPRVDACDRLWIVDTGHLEVPGVRKQIQPPAIIIYDLKTNQEIMRHELDPSIKVNERTSAGLTSITVDVHPNACNEAFAYINDLATEGLVVFSLRDQQSWRLDHPSFQHDEAAVNFTAAGHLINWKDGLFSVTLSKEDGNGRRKAYFHPMVSTQEFSVDTDILKNKNANLDGHIKLVGDRGPLSQSGSHDVHHSSGAMFFASLAQDGIACWNVDKPLTPDNVLIAAKDSEELGYISDLKVSGDYVWVLTNGIPKFIYNTQDISKTNYYIRRYSVQELIESTICDYRKLYKQYD